MSPESLHLPENNKYRVRLEEALDLLKQHDWTVPFEICVAPEVTREGLRGLADLPFEVSITEADGEIILSTGTPDAAIYHEGTVDAQSGLAPWSREVERRHLRGRLSGHTHPLIEGFERLTIRHIPSSGDIIGFAQRTASMPPFIIASSGICFFCVPSDAESLAEDIEDAKAAAPKAQGDALGNAQRASEDVRALLLRRGVLLREIPWDDRVSVEQFIGCLVGKVPWESLLPTESGS